MQKIKVFVVETPFQQLICCHLPVLLPSVVHVEPVAVDILYWGAMAGSNEGAVFPCFQLGCVRVQKEFAASTYVIASHLVASGHANVIVGAVEDVA